MRKIFEVSLFESTTASGDSISLKVQRDLVRMIQEAWERNMIPTVEILPGVTTQTTFRLRNGEVLPRESRTDLKLVRIQVSTAVPTTFLGYINLDTHLHILPMALVPSRLLNGSSPGLSMPQTPVTLIASFCKNQPTKSKAGRP